MAERKESKSPLDITIVGAGLAGHNVLVTESARELAEVSVVSLIVGYRQEF
jgi:hypothetical protein